jgi:hypothetical protein
VRHDWLGNDSLCRTEAMMIEKLKIFFTWVKNVWFRPLIVQPIQDITPKGETPKRKYDKQKSKTLSDLLDELEYTFDAMEIDYDRAVLSIKIRCQRS